MQVACKVHGTTVNKLHVCVVVKQLFGCVVLLPSAGDLASHAPGGYIRVVDRKKDMILCGGENVYCTEVEAVLMHHPAVAQAAVFGVPNAVMGELVAAAVILKPDAAAAPAVDGSSAVASDLTEWCRKRLAYYKVPSTVHIVNSMPTTGSGKILKTALRERFAAVPLPTGSAAAKPAEAAVEAHLAVPGISLLQLAATATAALSAAAVPEQLQQQQQPLPPPQLSDPGLVLSADVTYVLPLVDGAAADLQVQSALAKGACHLLLLAGRQPGAAALQQLEGMVHEAGADMAFAIVDAAVGADASLLGYALYDAKEDMPPVGSVLVPAEVAAATAPPSAVAAPALAAAAAAPSAAASVEAAMASVVKEAITDLLGAAAAGSIGDNDPLMQSGVNSTLAVQLTGSLEARLGICLPATLVGALTWWRTHRPVGLDCGVDRVMYCLRMSNHTLVFLLCLIVCAEHTLQQPCRVTCLLTNFQQECAHCVIFETLPAAAAALIQVFDYPSIREVCEYLAGTYPESVAPEQLEGAAEQGLTADEIAITATAEQLVSSAVADLLGSSAAAGIGRDEPLMQAGVNSTLAVQLTGQLESTLGASLPATLVSCKLQEHQLYFRIY